MEVTYRKNLNKSYMCVETQDPALEPYELPMMECQNIHELLKMHRIVADQSYRYLYDITGKQQIADYFSGQRLGYGFLQRFLFSIQGMCASLPEYLLREDAICMELDFIYINLEDGSLQFTYLPFYQKSLPDAFQGCMEQLLRKIDHQDPEAVELGYQVYQACIQDNINMERILGTLLGRREVPAERSRLKDNARIPENPIRQKEKIEASEVLDKENLKQEHKKNSKEIDIIQRIRGFAKKFTSDGGSVKNYLPGFWKGKKNNPLEGKNFQKRSSSAKKEIPGCKGQQEEKETCPQPEPVAPPTEILSASVAGIMGKLVYQGIHACEDIIVEGENFLLGKNSLQVDGVIDADGVSRLHARIIRQEEQYFIEDLNSTNGTYLNDTPLEYHQPQALGRNDKIRFGAEEYVFL